MTQQQHPELVKAKMLARKAAASENVSVPPLSRLRRATTLFVSACWLLLCGIARRTSMYLRDKQQCPKCFGCKRQLTHVVHDEFEMRDCRLCKGTGEVTWREVESFKWGNALLAYRLNAGLSLAQMYYAVGLAPDVVQRLERGLVPLDDWPDTARNVAEKMVDHPNAVHS